MGASFLTSTSSSAAASDGDAAWSPTRSSFAYEVTRERATSTAPRGAEARDTPTAGKAIGAEEEPWPDDWSIVATVAALDDLHTRPDEERGSDEVAGVEEEHGVSATAMDDVKGEDGGHVATGDDEAASMRSGEEEEREAAAMLEESSREQ